MSANRNRLPRREAYMTYYQDGLWDMAIGLFLLVCALGFARDSLPVAAITVLLAEPAVRSAKKYLVVPRLGPSELMAGQLTPAPMRRVVLAIVTLVLGLLVLLRALSPVLPVAVVAFVRSLGVLPVGAVLAAVLAVFAALYRTPRWLGYAVAVLLVFASGPLLDSPDWLVFAVSGGIVLLGGVLVLRRFLDQHHLPTPSTQPA